MVKHFRIFFTEFEVLNNLEVKVCEEWTNNTMESKETGKTNVENVVNDGSCKDLEAQKKIEETCQEAEHRFCCYQERGKLINVVILNILIPIK